MRKTIPFTIYTWTRTILSPRDWPLQQKGPGYRTLLCKVEWTSVSRFDVQQHTARHDIRPFAHTIQGPFPQPNEIICGTVHIVENIGHPGAAKNVITRQRCNRIIPRIPGARVTIPNENRDNGRPFLHVQATISKIHLHVRPSSWKSFQRSNGRT